MNLLKAETTLWGMWHRSHQMLTATVAILLAAGCLGTGCANNETKEAGTGATNPAKGQAAPAGSGIATPTPEQEAARKLGEEQGPAIAAANEEATKGNH